VAQKVRIMVTVPIFTLNCSTIRGMVISDQPIQKKEQDQLKRNPLASKIAEVVLQYDNPDKESFVIGIDGAWGSGKTSFVNLILQELGEQVVLIPFNPWLFSDPASLLGSFFQTFGEHIKPYVGGDTLKNIKRYAKIVADVDLGFSLLGVGINPMKAISSFLSLDDISLTGQREQLNKALQKMNKKILVIIDDIDRLEPEETKLIFKLIKVSANFRNTIFLIAYDRKRVASQLTNEAARFDGNEYLKKIIQVNFLLPEPEPEDLWDVFIADLNQTLRDVYGTDDVDNARWVELFHGGLKGLFKTLRDTKAFINSLKIDWSIAGGDDVDPIDFIGIEGIRVFAPEFYGLIAGNLSFFTGTHPLMVGLPQKKEVTAIKEKYEEMLETVPKNIREDVKKICAFLFPHLDNEHYSSENEIKWRKNKRVCSAEKFRFYFQLGIPRGLISEVELKGLIKTLKKEKDFYDTLKKFEADGKLKKVLGRILDYAQSLSEAQICNFVTVIWRIQDENKERWVGSWDFDDIESQSERIVYNIIKDNVDITKRAELVTDLIKRSKYLYPPVNFGRLLVHEYNRKGKEGDGSLIGDGIEDIKKAGLEKIKDAVADGELRAHPRLMVLLYGWRDFGEEEKMREYVKGLVGSTQGVLELLASSVNWILSSAGNYQKISREDLDGLYPKEEFKQKVAEITDQDLRKATETQKKAVELYRNPPSRW